MNNPNLLSAEVQNFEFANRDYLQAAFNEIRNEDCSYEEFVFEEWLEIEPSLSPGNTEKSVDNAAVLMKLSHEESSWDTGERLAVA